MTEGMDDHFLVTATKWKRKSQ